MPKTYTVSFKLWDATKGERTAELIDEDGPHTVSPLSAINEPWEAWTRESPAPLDPLNPRTIRVSMSRNDGESVTRRRFEHEGSKYLITIHVSPVAESWEADIQGFGPVTVRILQDTPRIFVPGNGWTAMTRQKND